MGERSHTSDCGNVTVTVGEAPAPTIELADGAVRMFARDLAELVTATARAAADAYAAELELPDTPSIEETITELTGLRDGLKEDGLTAVLDRRRAELAEPEDEATPRDLEGGEPGLVLPKSAMDLLESNIEMLRRFNESASGTGTSLADDSVTGKATSPSKLVTVESSLTYPIESVSLGKRACEIGPKALAAEINETAAAAAEDLAKRQDGYFKGLGLQTGPGELAAASAELKDMGERAAQGVTALRDYQQDVVRRFNQGGYFA